MYNLQKWTVHQILQIYEWGEINEKDLFSIKNMYFWCYKFENEKFESDMFALQ